VPIKSKNNSLRYIFQNWHNLINSALLLGELSPDKNGVLWLTIGIVVMTLVVFQTASNEK
jgi:hypothetical protein